MDYVELLIKSAEQSGSIACLGMDPIIEKIPIKEQSPEKKIVKFYSDILEVCSTKVSAVKPNYAFFAQYGFPGLKALKKVIVASKKKKLIVILDAKRADIGKTSEALAREAFEFWKADAVTVAPYMGKDSIEPFTTYSAKSKGVYVLVRTSNKGAQDFQDLKVDNEKVYSKVAKKLIEWHSPGVSAIVGATSIKELEELNNLFKTSGKKIPLLIPGVGSQGGSAKEVVSALKDNLLIHRINSSSAINYAYEEQKTEDYASAALKALQQLNSEIGKL
jgi:orotidine-5'-phosphate decarboxylase